MNSSLEPTAEPKTATDEPAVSHDHRDVPGVDARPYAPAINPEQGDVSDEDRAAVKRERGRAPRGVVAVAARCVCGRPTVVRTAPRLPDGTPFPTSFYLTHPGAVSAVSTLEASGLMTQMTERLAEDADLAAAFRAAHEDYLVARAELGDVPEIEGISAGGMPGRVKCLHVLVGHALARGKGVNPFGDEALELIAHEWSPNRCTC